MYQELVELMFKHGLVIRAIPSTKADIMEVRHKDRFPEGKAEYLEDFNREMWVVVHNNSLGGKFIVETVRHQDSVVRFTRLSHTYDSIEDIINYYRDK